MVIIGFVVTVMIFSSFAIVFSNSGNNLNNIKTNTNLSVNSFTINKKTINLSNAHNDLNSPIEFCKNFMIYDNSNNILVLVNLTNNNSINTNITYDTTHNSFYYGIITNYNNIYIYALCYNSNNYPNLELDNYSKNLKFNKFSTTLIQDSTCYQPIGITANNLGIFTVFEYEINCNDYNLYLDKFSYNNELITDYTSSTEIIEVAHRGITAIVNNGFLYAYTYCASTSAYSYMVNLNSGVMTGLSTANNLSGEMIYNSNYTNNFNVNTSKSLNNTYTSNNINYGYAYSGCYELTTNSQNISDTNYRDNAKGEDVSFTNAHFFNNAKIQENRLKTEYCFLFNNINYGQITTFDLPYSYYNNVLYYTNNPTSYTIVNFIQYKLNITSYNHNSKQLKDYFYYNNNFYYGNQFNFTNSNGIFSILPLNY